MSNVILCMRVLNFMCIRAPVRRLAFVHFLWYNRRQLSSGPEINSPPGQWQVFLWTVKRIRKVHLIRHEYYAIRLTSCNSETFSTINCTDGNIYFICNLSSFHLSSHLSVEFNISCTYNDIIFNYWIMTTINDYLLFNDKKLLIKNLFSLFSTWWTIRVFV